MTDALDGLVTAARARSEPPPSNSAAELQNLVQAYAVFTDRGLADELAGLFTDDATWDGTALGYGSARGPAEIVEVVLQHVDPARPMIHLPGPPLLVHVADDHARGMCWCLATRATDGAAGPLIFFYYDDEFRRDDAGRWLFSRRTLHLRFRS